MEDLAVNDHLAKEDIFRLFKMQLQKDFESAGLDAVFVNGLKADLELLIRTIQEQLGPLVKTHQNGLMALLYRVDISQEQIRRHQSANPDLSLEQSLSELVVKRILQKVILKKTFSK